MFSRYKSLFLIISFVLVGASLASAQDTKPSEKPKDEKQKIEKPKKETPKAQPLPKIDPKNLTAEQVAESVIFIYGGGGGREGLKQIRKTTIESGKLNITNPDGTNDQVNYERRIMRGDSLEKERIRFDQEFPNARYALIYSDNKVIGLYNDAAFTPREDATKAFQNQIWHGLEALLRYKENGSTVEIAGHEKIMNVDYTVLNVTDKTNRKTKFYISAKTFHVMWLEYKEDDVNYTRRFYDYRYAQGTLVPYRTVLLANEKQIEEGTISTSLFGQRIDENIFRLLLSKN